MFFLSLDLLALWRRRTYGIGSFVLALLRWSMSIDLPEDIMNHPQVLQAEKMAGYHAGVANDLLSYRREIKRMGKTGEVGDVGVNAVFAVMRERGVSEPEALAWVEGYLLSLEREFEEEVIKLHRQFEGNEYEFDLRKYMAGARQVMAGNLEWSCYCGRYKEYNRA